MSDFPWLSHRWSQWNHAWVPLNDTRGTMINIGLYRYCKKCGKLEVEPVKLVANSHLEPLDMSKVHHLTDRSES